MRSPKFLFLILSLVLLAGCDSSQEGRSTSIEPSEPAGAGSSAKKETSLEGFISEDQRAEARPQSPVMQQVSLNQADQSQSVAEAVDRKIIRDGNLRLEVTAPADAQRKVTSIAESAGGFVVTSEAKRHENADTSRQALEVTLVVRVPALQFGPVMDQIRAIGTHVVQEKITGQDVTEEFIDLEARIKTQKALEGQFLEIMKRASKVEDALEVQRQIAEVRTEIEKLEGRKRFLGNRASLSTITVTLHEPNAIVVSSSSFGRSVKEAVREAVDVAGAIVLFLIRFVIVMVPIFVLVILPFGLIARFFWRRANRKRLKPETVTE
ncbi:MAG: DUF4349 domain-containing protein [Pyrinomonadaceae bacterium]|nr:DUF4349 domain-containing protein [Pyrinomonadaceae bacterium]